MGRKILSPVYTGMDHAVGDLVKTGMIMSALPAINAIPGVAAARFGNQVQTVLVVEQNDVGYTGSQTGEDNEEPILNITVEGGMVSWSSRITKPMKLKCEFKGVINDDQITGRVKAGIFGSFPFTGQKI